MKFTVENCRAATAAPRGELEDQRACAIAGAAAIMMGLTTGVAAASNFGSANGQTGCSDQDITANNPNEYVKYYNLSALMASATDSALNNVYAPTDLTIYRTTSDTTADLIVKDYNLTDQCGLDWDDPASDLIAWNYCARANSDQECDLSITVYDDDNVNDSAAQRNFMACHETGHAIGLAHKTEGNEYTGVSCMAAIFATGRDALTAHDIGEVNDWYPERSGS